ncbi:type VI secretion system membrane subunit TssM [Gilvimarinus sp. F26214L]|uniref:type VI secretion system membrane subunit TssM n=1 Tax=Gilvimarinus sp. DZF01 TaxID=3461371 RepID=UPI004045A851
MKKIGRFLTHPIVMSVFGLVLLSLLIWFAGPLIKFGEDNSAPLSSVVARLLTIMVIVLIWGLNNLRIQLRNNKSNQELLDDIGENNEAEQPDLASSQASEEIHQMNERFAQALATLGKLKFQGRGRKKAVYELPWYIIVGPPGSGKTTALVNSGLDFPLADQFGKGAVQGVGGTRNCDWWFTNEAVLIDTAGRYTTQDSHRVVDSSAWEGFLSLLKRNRRRRPINGAIVAISLHDLLTQTEEERAQQARTIRLRLDELMEKLEIRFPVYLLFTKTDMVSGFAEFFEDLGREEREQVWGVSLPNAPKASEAPDFQFLKTELTTLIHRLYDRVLFRMHQERDVKRCAAIQGFPQQMENLSTIIDGFVNQTFCKNRFHYQPYLRGVYFSSGTQDGTSIDRLMTSVSANFGFSREASQSASQQGKSFFISRLFREVIFPESELVGSNARYEKLLRWSQRAAYVGLAVTTVLVVLTWTGSLTRNKMYMNEVAGHVEEFRKEEARLSRWNSDIRTVLPALNALAQARTVYDQESHPWLSGIGLYDGRVDRQANRAYEAKLKSLLLPRLLETLELSLRSGAQQGDLYNTFRTYVMFSKVEHMEAPRVADWFAAHWSQHLRGAGTHRKELQTHLEALLQLPLEPQPLDERVVAQSRAALLAVPVSQRVYSRLKSNAEYNRPVDMLNYYGESVKSSFRIDERTREALAVPALYTIDAYKQIDFSPESPAVADVVNERWILGDEEDAGVDFLKQDLDEISEQVKEHYLADYGRAWSEVYRSLDIAQFGGLRELNEALTVVVDPVYSPILSILRVGKDNTELTPALDVLGDKLDGAADQAGDVPGRAGYLASRGGRLAAGAGGLLADKVEGTAVDKRFRSLNLLLRESPRGPAPIEATMRRVEELQRFVEEITLAPDPAQKSFEVAKARYQSGASNPITSLRAYARSTPDPVRRWLTSLADESWRVVLESAHQHVNAEWQARVYGSYSRALAGRYPLHRSARDELAPADFSAFFKPQGTLHTFFSEYIEPFIETRGRWENKSIDNYSIGFSPSSLAQLRRAAEIRNIFFRESRESPSIKLELRPYNMDRNDARFTLDLGEQRLTYSHGPKFWTTVTWSGNSDARRVRLVFEDLDSAVSEATYTGPWAWFRLMDDASIKAASQSNVYWITFSTRDDAREIVFEGKATSIHNPFKNDLIGLFRCPESI